MRVFSDYIILVVVGFVLSIAVGWLLLAGILLLAVHYIVHVAATAVDAVIGEIGQTFAMACLLFAIVFLCILLIGLMSSSPLEFLWNLLQFLGLVGS